MNSLLKLESKKNPFKNFGFTKNDYKKEGGKTFYFFVTQSVYQCNAMWSTVYVQEIVAVTITISKSIYGNNCVIHKSCKKIAFCYFAKIVLGNGVAVLLQIYIRTHTKRL